MLDYMPFAIPFVTSDMKASTRDIAVDPGITAPPPVPIPTPTPIPIPGIDTGSNTGTTTKPTTGTGANVSDLSSAAMKAAMGSLAGGASLPSISAPSQASASATGRSGDASSNATFGDFIVNGSKNNSITTMILVIGGVAAGLILLKKLIKK